MAITKFDGDYAFLSNFFMAPVRYHFDYTNAEAAYQSRKAADAADILKFTEYGPGMAKKMKRHLKKRADWNDVRVAFMRDIVYAKFMQNPELAARLKATGTEELVEGNHWRDTFWGVNENTGEGQNILGKILMEVRANLDKLDVRAENAVVTRFTVPEMAAHDNINFAQVFELSRADIRYSVRGRNFVGLNFRDGEIISALHNNELRRHADGTQFLYQRENLDERVFYRDELGVNCIHCRQPAQQIYICLGLKNPPPQLAELLKNLTE